MTKSLAAALLISTATFAHAQNVVATGAEPDQRALRHADGRIGLLLGGADVGDAQGFSAGASLGVGYRIGDVSVRGLLDYYKVGDGQDAEMPRHGRAARVGGAVRYSLASTERDADLNIDFWGELGAGWEHVTWLHGGVLDRPSVETAIGIDFGRRGDHRDRDGRRREIGTFLAFRTLIGQAPEVPGAMATCSGPCTEATTPPRTDVTMFFEIGTHWGR